MPRRTHLIPILAILALTLAAGCGGDRQAVAAERGATAAATADPCSLVPLQDMAVMFGAIKDGPLPSSGLREERQCNYTNETGSWIKLSLARGADRWEWERGVTGAQSPRDVGGLGDEAFAIRRGTDAVVYVRKGESILELSCSCPADTAETIARVATTRL